MIRFEGKNMAARVGDIFAIEYPDCRIPGRVVSTEMSVSGGARLKVVYLFRPVDKGWTPESDREPLQISNLLVKPQIVNNLGWSRGYFKTIQRADFLPGERLERTRFVSPVDVGIYRGVYFDEFGRPAGPAEFLGEYAVGSYTTVDFELSHILGIPEPG